MDQEALAQLLQLRHVAKPCPTCSGLGGKWYGSTATWRGGIGGAAMTWAVCDECWGSGDQEHAWEDLRKQRDQETQRVHERAANLFSRSLGGSLRLLRPTFEELAGELDRLARQRRPRPYYWAHVCELLAKLLRGFSVAKETEGQYARPSVE
jgi:hypothetical protein